MINHARRSPAIPGPHKPAASAAEYVGGPDPFFPAITPNPMKAYCAGGPSWGDGRLVGGRCDAVGTPGDTPPSDPRRGVLRRLQQAVRAAELPSGWKPRLVPSGPTGSSPRRCRDARIIDRNRRFHPFCVPFRLLRASGLRACGNALGRPLAERQPARWGGGRVVEGAPLLRVYTGNGIEGSNPFLSASAAGFNSRHNN